MCFFGDFLDEEFNRYGSRHFYNCKRSQSKYYRDIQNKVDATLSTLKERKEEELERLVTGNFDAKIDNYNYSIVDMGRYGSKAFVFNDSFSMEKSYLKKAGPNYIMEIGKLIGGQIHLEENELDREHDVYLNYAKQYKFEISFTIPEGYTIVGIDKLQKNTSNTTGSFKSAAIIEGNVLKINTSKIYAKRKYLASEWAQMISWLETAYNFSQEKIMLKKL